MESLELWIVLCLSLLSKRSYTRLRKVDWYVFKYWPYSNGIAKPLNISVIKSCFDEELFYTYAKLIPRQRAKNFIE